jgi:hypothetical protein
MNNVQTQEKIFPICTRCKKEEGETIPIGTFTVQTEKHTVCGKLYSHTCGCITTAHCEHGVGAPEADKYYGTFGSEEEIQELFPNIELKLF